MIQWQNLVPILLFIKDKEQRLCLWLVRTNCPTRVMMLFTSQQDASFFITLVTQAFLLAAAAIVIIRAKALPAWLGWSAATFALLLLVGIDSLLHDSGEARCTCLS